MSDRPPPTEAAARPWTAAETAEDLLAQVEDALRDGASDATTAAALEREGASPEVAAWIVEDVRSAADPALVDEGTRGDVGPDAVAISLFRLRVGLRAEDQPLVLPPERADALRAALAKAGLRASAADALVDDGLRMERAMGSTVRARLRRLATQGMVVSGAGTALFVLGGTAGGAARWHWLSAVFTGAFFLYALALHRRNRETGSEDA